MRGVSAATDEERREAIRAAKRAYYQRNAEALRAAQRQRTRNRTEDENRERALVDRSRPKGYLTGLVSVAKQRTANKAGLQFDLTRDQLLDLYADQQGCCAISGMAMTTIPGRGRVRTNISLDRIDSTLGYTIDNVQLVCDLINTMKQNLSMDEFVDLCRIVIAQQEVQPWIP